MRHDYAPKNYRRDPAKISDRIGEGIVIALIFLACAVDIYGF